MNGREILAQVVRSADSYEVQLRIGEARFEPSPFAFDLRPGSRTSQEIRYIEASFPDTDVLRSVGMNLWDALVPASLQERVRSMAREGEPIALQLEVPAALASLPWETLYDSELTFLACHPKLVVLHVSPQRAAPPREPSDALSVLFVVPQGANLSSEDEQVAIRNALKKLAHAGSFDVLDGVVTPDRFAAQLRARHWTIVHFVGHGRRSATGVEVRLNDERGEERWQEVDQFCALFQDSQVDVCVLNCCHGGSAAPVERTMDQLAPSLVAVGVRGVVAMRYAMRDRSAVRFAESFYGQLLHGAQAGRLACAVQWARQSLRQNAVKDDRRSFVTPLVHIAGCDDRMFEQQARSFKPSAPVKQEPVVRIPDELACALRDRRCVLVVGMQLIAPPLERDGGGSPGLLEVLERLEQLLRKQAQTEPRMATPVPELPRAPDARFYRLAERYEADENLNLDELLIAIRDYYKAAQPSELHRMVAQLGAPGAFYLHFDGLLDRAYAEQNTPATLVRSVIEAPASKEPPLVLVRGTISDLVSGERPDSPLVLSEYDHLVLSDAISRMNNTLEALARGHLGRVVLFLGADPGDAIARQLARKLLVGRASKPTASFFVSSRHDPGDELFWRRFRSRFLPVPTDAFVRAAFALVKQP